MTIIFCWRIFLTAAVILLACFTAVSLLRVSDAVRKLDRILADHLAQDPRYEEVEGP